MKKDVLSLSGEVIESIDLDDFVFNHPIRKDIIARVVRWQLSKRRSGNHKVKTRSEVKHTTRKPFKQKGTGRARQGMLRVPHMRGGGVAFGPVVRSHEHKLNKKVKAYGLRSAISSKIEDGSFKVVDSLLLNTIKTKDFLSKIKNLVGDKSCLFISDDSSIELQKSVSNIIGYNTLLCEGVNVYDLLKHDTIIASKDAVKKIEEKLSGKK